MIGADGDPRRAALERVRGRAVVAGDGVVRSEDQLALLVRNACVVGRQVIKLVITWRRFTR